MNLIHSVVFDYDQFQLDVNQFMELRGTAPSLTLLITLFIYIIHYTKLKGFTQVSGGGENSAQLNSGIRILLKVLIQTNLNY